MFDSCSHLFWWHPRAIWRARYERGTRRVLGAWALVSIASIVAGPFTADWNGIPIKIGPLTLNLSFYPPLTLCLLLVLWVGPFWGIVPAYLTSFVIAVQKGMPLMTSAVFSLATPITLLVLWNLMVMLEVTPSLKTWLDLARFAVVSLVATGASSIGALVWNYHNHLQFSNALAVWEGWVLGDFVQVVIIVGALLHCCHNPVQRWLASQVRVAPQESLNTRFFIAMFLLVFVVMITVGGTAASLFLSSLNATEARETIALSILHKTLSEAVFFVGFYAFVFMVSVIVFSSTLGSQVQRCLRDIAERKRIQEEREKLICRLQDALSKVRILSGLLPICANCKKVRDDKGYWNQIETYIRDHSEAQFSHGICPECMQKLYPEFCTPPDTDTGAGQRFRRCDDRNVCS